MLPHRSAPTLTDDELTLHLIATGLIRLTQRSMEGLPAFPYPQPLQHGLDRLTVAAIRRGTPPPQGIPQLLAWCQDSITNGPLGLASSMLSPDETLLIGDQISSTCDDWACAAADVEADLTERLLMQRVFQLCREAQDQTGYVAFRSLVIERPVLTALELQQHCIRPELIRLSAVLRDAYQPAPAGLAINGAFACCQSCNNLLTPRLGGFVCETDACRSIQPIQVGQTIPVHAAPVWLIRGLRRFVFSPGRAEVRLARWLAAAGLQVECWPNLDAYDLRITFANGEVWAVDVKDWANPFLLARRVEPIPADPPWDRAFFVFPSERVEQRRDYVRAFRRTCGLLSARTVALSEPVFMQQIGKRGA